VIAAGNGCKQTKTKIMKTIEKLKKIELSAKIYNGNATIFAENTEKEIVFFDVSWDGQTRTKQTLISVCSKIKEKLRRDGLYPSRNSFANVKDILTIHILN
jgi:hypothetical protein